MPGVRIGFGLLVLVLTGSVSSSAQGLPALLPDPAELSQWRDSITVSGQRYAVPDRWRGRRLGLSDATPPADLVLIPRELRASDREVLLRLPALLSFRAMAAEAALDSVFLRAQSGYRSTDTQTQLIVTRLEQGREFEEILRGVAPPGYSEHMLGMTLDLALGGDYDNNPAYHWLLENAAVHGWYESYPRDLDDGFPWEPWHWRFHGKDGSRVTPFPTPSSEENP
jgi:hypothetical protein